MKKYSQKLVMDYINGLDIEEYDIDTLESDVDFMIQVIELTDEKSYQLCDDTLRANYTLVKYLINKFKSNLDFITEVAKNYFNAEKPNFTVITEEDGEVTEEVVEDLETLEIRILLDKYTSNLSSDDVFDNNLLIENKIILFNFYTRKRLELISAASLLEEDIQMGFEVIMSEYRNSDLIKNYIAEHMLYDIFYGEDKIDLKKAVNTILKTKKNTKKLGYNSCLIDIISSCDTYLADYASVHLDLIKDYVKLLERAVASFEVNSATSWYDNKGFDYIDSTNLPTPSKQELIETIITEIFLFYEENQCKITLTEQDLIKYIADIFGLGLLFKKYYPRLSNIIDDYDNVECINPDNIKQQDKNVLETLKKQISTLLSSKSAACLYEIDEELIPTPKTKTIKLEDYRK